MGMSSVDVQVKSSIVPPHSIRESMANKIEHVGDLNRQDARHHALTAESRMQRQSISHVEPVFFVFIHFGQVIFAFSDYHVAGCASAISAAVVFEIDSKL